MSWDDDLDHGEFMAFMAAEGGCLICGWYRAETHHTRGRRFYPWYCVRLCSHHHTGNAGVHTQGRRTFARRERVCLPGQALIHLARFRGSEGSGDLAF